MFVVVAVFRLGGAARYFLQFLFSAARRVFSLFAVECLAFYDYLFTGGYRGTNYFG
jgi:hypothetical protein